ncbi:MAG: ornithine carbamoyltransferase [Gammaproteobacteria bacterium]
MRQQSTFALTGSNELLHHPFANRKVLQPRHLLTGEELKLDEIKLILHWTKLCKKARQQGQLLSHLVGQHLALLFDKPSLRTRFSFTVAMRELGGDVIESLADTRKNEAPEDQVRVLSGYCHAIMMRTHDDSILQQMSNVATVPIINGLTNLHHPCQVLADLFTLTELFGKLDGLTLCYIGDGNNILHSLLLLAPMMSITLHYCCPPTRGPNEKILARAKARTTQHPQRIQAYQTVSAAVHNAHAVYTDVWTSMGFEDCRAEHLFTDFQVNETLMKKAHLNAVFMHCLPMERGKEVSETLPDHPCSVIFQQSENRLHLQKALLLYLLNKSL